MGGKGSGGSNRISVQEHKLRGTYRPARHGQRERLETRHLADASEVPDPPDWLDADAKAEWWRLAPKVAGLTEVDVGPLAVLCQSIAHNRQWTAVIEREGRLVDGPNGPRAHPLIRHAQVNRASILSYARMYGFTPASRGTAPEPPLPELPRPLPPPPPRFRRDPDLDPVA